MFRNGLTAIAGLLVRTGNTAIGSRAVATGCSRIASSRQLGPERRDNFVIERQGDRVRAPKKLALGRQADSAASLAHEDAMTDQRLQFLHLQRDRRCLPASSQLGRPRPVKALSVRDQHEAAQQVDVQLRGGDPTPIRLANWVISATRFLPSRGGAQSGSTQALVRNMTLLPLVTLTLAAFAIGTTEFSIQGLLPEVAADMHVGIPDAGLLVTGYALGVSIGGPIIAILTNSLRLSRRPCCC